MEPVGQALEIGLHRGCADGRARRGTIERLAKLEFHPSVCPAPFSKLTPSMTWSRSLIDTEQISFISNTRSEKCAIWPKGSIQIRHLLVTTKA